MDEDEWEDNDRFLTPKEKWEKEHISNLKLDI